MFEYKGISSSSIFFINSVDSPTFNSLTGISMTDDTPCMESDQLVIEGKYQLECLIGKGSFGAVFEAKNVVTGEGVAVKLDSKDSAVLRNEARIYKLLSDVPGLPKLRAYGKHKGTTYLVLDRLGPSIEDLKVQCGNRFSLKSSLMFGISALTRIEKVHACGVIHRDIKPDNFLIGLGADGKRIIHMIDFGLAKRYVGDDGEHISAKSGRKLTGTVRYASVSIHEGYTPSRRDDLEALGYVILYLMNGSLPWQEVRQESKESRNREIGAMKSEHSMYDLFPGTPGEMLIWIEYCRALEFDEDPDYKYLRGLLTNLFKHHGFEMDGMYDWSV